MKPPKFSMATWSRSASRGSANSARKSSRRRHIRTVTLRSAHSRASRRVSHSNRHPSRLAKTLAPQDDGTHL
jgi:hypothetical protein